MSASYLNPWHDPKQTMYGPRYYFTEANPVEYRECQIYHVHSLRYDIVSNGVCIGQVGSIKFAKKQVDLFVGDRPADGVDCSQYDSMHKWAKMKHCETTAA
jgi:hypothetical protein